MKAALQWCFLILCLALPLTAQSQTPTPTPSCAGSNSSTTIYDALTGLAPQIADSTEHVTYNHSVTFGTFASGDTSGNPANAKATGQANCSYSHSGGSNVYCNTTCTVVNAGSDNLNPLAGITAAENGTLTGLLPKVHFVATAFQGGFATATNAGASCTGIMGGGAASCGIFNVGCSLSISVTAGSSGPSLTVNNSSGTVIWTNTQSFPNNCAAVGDPQGPGGTGTGNCPTAGGNPRLYAPPPDPSCNSPIILDVEGEGFHLTSAANGVTFDIRGDGHPFRLAWTDARFHNAFLALPGPDGMVHDGRHLFGNFTPQPPSRHPNGFLALVEFDKPENGGNGDGVIDERDAVWSKLRLWIDENHDGISQPNELHTLTEFGIYSLSLKYFESGREDEFGNRFRYRARVNPDSNHRDRRDETPTGEVGRWAYDVFFVAQ